MLAITIRLSLAVRFCTGLGNALIPVFTALQFPTCIRCVGCGWCWFFSNVGQIMASYLWNLVCANQCLVVRCREIIIQNISAIYLFFPAHNIIWIISNCSCMFVVLIQRLICDNKLNLKLLVYVQLFVSLIILMYKK